MCSIYIIQHNLTTNTWQVQEAQTLEQAQAFAGPTYTNPITYGQTLYVQLGQKKDWFEENWYKVITAVAVVSGVYVSLRK